MCDCGNEVHYKKTGECRQCYHRRYNRAYYDQRLSEQGKQRKAPSGPKHLTPAGRPLLPVVDLHRPITYSTAHTRLMNWRGSAKHQTCVDCGQQAAQWSYTHSGSHEIRGTKVNQHGKTIEVAWSTDVREYEARCINCHKTHDKARVI